MFEGDVEGMKAALCVSKAQVGDCIILCSASPTSHLAPAPPPCEMSKLLLNRQAPGSLPDPSPAAQLLPCAHSSEGPAAAFHSTGQVPVYTPASPVRLGLYLFIFPSLAQHLSGMNQC